MIFSFLPPNKPLSLSFNMTLPDNQNKLRWGRQSRSEKDKKPDPSGKPPPGANAAQPQTDDGKTHLPGEDLSIGYSVAFLGGGVTLAAIGWFAELQVLKIGGIVAMLPGVYLAFAKGYKWSQMTAGEISSEGVETGVNYLQAANCWLDDRKFDNPDSILKKGWNLLWAGIRFGNPVGLGLKAYDKVTGSDHSCEKTKAKEDEDKKSKSKKPPAKPKKP